MIIKNGLSKAYLFSKAGTFGAWVGGGRDVSGLEGQVRYDKIVRGYSDESQAIGGGVGFSDDGAVSRGHMHWTNTSPSAGDLANAAAWSQQYSGYKAWVGSWDGWKCIGATASLIRSQR